MISLTLKGGCVCVCEWERERGSVIRGVLQRRRAHILRKIWPATPPKGGVVRPCSDTTNRRRYCPGQLQNLSFTEGRNCIAKTISKNNLYHSTQLQLITYVRQIDSTQKKIGIVSDKTQKKKKFWCDSHYRIYFQSNNLFEERRGKALFSALGLKRVLYSYWV